MAPNKKKKKPASNPARGFATTSIASKPKSQDNRLQDEPVLPNGDSPSSDVESNKDQVDRIGPQSSIDVSRGLYELSPEELESQLEESDLQLLLEKNGEKSKKDALRQVDRLRTERRTLRPQAQYLNTRAWLPSELMQQLMDLSNNQTHDENPNAERDDRQSRPILSEDGLVIKLWTLEQVLFQLGFSQERTNIAVSQLLNKDYSIESTYGRDMIWGLESCLDWLALVCELEEMPDYEMLGSQNHIKTIKTADAVIGAGTPHSTPTESRPPSPLPLSNPKQVTQSVDHPFENTSDFTEVESDDDIEPAKLVDKYISLRKRLCQILPNHLQPGSEKRKGFKSTAKSDQTQEEGLRPETASIISKMNSIDSDILFDRGEADRRWVVIQNDLAKEAAERRKLHLDNGTSPLGISRGNDMSKKDLHSDTASTSTVTEDDNLDMVRDLFSMIPASTIDTDTGPASMTSTGSDGTAIVVTDFGKWTGQSPRRIFEEACKARDSLCKVTYKIISSSSFSYRQSVFIAWSCSQVLPIESPCTAILCNADQRYVTIQMASISTLTSIQSEAYVSTVALFLVFSSVPKEEKAHLRLPPTWRDLWIELSKMRKEQADTADRDVLRGLRSLVVHNEYKAQKNVTHKNGFRSIETLTEGTKNTQASTYTTHERVDSSAELRSMWLSKASTQSYGHMLNSRKNLPIWNFKDNLLSTIEKHQVVIVCGETGCGKSTQVPAFVLENELSNGRPCKVYCTEPRRISAISLARRVSEELGESRHDVGSSRSLVGYAIRLESHVTSQTRLVYATTGIVMRMLERSDELGDITHLVLDEIHERSIDSDFLLIVLRKLMARRSNLKLILMSATVDAQRFSSYLDRAPIMTVPGRTFPVKTRFLEDAVELTKFDDHDLSCHTPQTEDIEDTDEVAVDPIGKQPSTDYLQGYSPKTRATIAKLDEYHIRYELIVKLLTTIATSPTYTSYSKAILVFLPGFAEIKRLKDMLLDHQVFSQRWRIYPLHSTVATEEQEQAFLVPPQGIRKIVLATNIAETGITIPDVTCVIDTGKHKEMRFDERRQLSRLIESFISRANAKQRRGRAGRVQNGLCFHLFTKARHDSIMAEEQTPEMLRLSLQDLVLRIKICKLGGIEQTLCEALDPPSSKNIRRAIESLIDVKALTATEDLTPLGRQLARLPLDVFLGKLILVGSIFRTLDAALTIAAILSSKSPFSAPMGARSQADVARLAYKKGNSDLLTVYNAYCSWRRVCGMNPSSELQFCRKNFLSPQTLSNIEDLKAQLTTSLSDAGFLTLGGGVGVPFLRTYTKSRRFVELPEIFNLNNNNDLILNSVIAWSFYPKLLKRDGKGWRNVANNQMVSLHPTSVNKGVERPPAWLSFYHTMQSSNKFYNAHETTAVEDFAIALVCGDADFKMYSGVIVIDGNRLRFRLDDWKSMVAIKALRGNIRQIISQAFRNPGRQLSRQQQAWFDIWQKIFRHWQELRDKR